jgi:tetratricopeptide (TPR) repeat protein
VLPASQFANPEASIGYYRERIRRNPNEVASYAALAQVLLQQASDTHRETEFVPQAQEAIEEGLSRAPNDYHLRLLNGTLLNKLHRFEDSRAQAQNLLAEHPNDSYAHGILVDALVELGEYPQAVEAMDAMLAIKPGIASYTRASYLRELHGDGPGAVAAMRMAADAGLKGTPDRSWALYNLANLYLADAKPDTARFIYEGILEEKPNYAPAVAGLGHVALVKGDLDEAESLLKEAYDLMPNDGFLELLAEVYAMKGDQRAADRTLDRVHEGLEAARDMGEIVDMEEADFLLDRGQDLDRSLRMAKEQVDRRPGHMHANETYAWALHHNGRSDEAIPYIERAMRLNTGDAMVHWRAAQIYQGAGNSSEAQRHARLALDGNLGVESPTAARDAQTLLGS